MPAPTTDAELIDLIQRSGVVESSRLTAYLQPLRDRSELPDDPTALASRMVRDGILTFFQSEQLLLGKWKRFSIGKYRVLERLGAGGMGQVFLCEHKLMRRRVAVKVLPTARAEEPDSLERFYREARAVAALDHPNLVRAFDIDQDEALHFLVLEYVDGANLQDIVRKSGPMDPIRACHYVYQAALGLQFAFEVAGVVHRDVKPSNILVDRTGLVKVLDMGLARFFHDEHDLLTKRSDDAVLGTADYLPPEQALDSHKVDIRGDIYSLGATLYYMLTGQPPFMDGTVAQKLIWHQTRQPKPVRLLRPDVPEAIAAIQDRMMAKDPGARYQTPADLAYGAGAVRANADSAAHRCGITALESCGGGPRRAGPEQTLRPLRASLAGWLDSSAAAVHYSDDSNRCSKRRVRVDAAGRRGEVAPVSTSAGDTPRMMSASTATLTARTDDSNPFASRLASSASGTTSSIHHMYAAAVQPTAQAVVPADHAHSGWLAWVAALGVLLAGGAGAYWHFVMSRM